MFPVTDNLNIIFTYNFRSESNKLKPQAHAYFYSFILTLYILLSHGSDSFSYLCLTIVLYYMLEFILFFRIYFKSLWDKVK